MGQLFTSKFAAYQEALRGRAIKDDHPCDQCGYNLRGLRFGGVCPECGSRIVIDESFGASLSLAPMESIRRMRAGFQLGVVCLPLLLLAPLGGAVAGGDLLALMLVLLAVSIAWAVAVWLITPAIDARAGARRGFGSRSKLRRAARLSQAAWVVAYGLALGAVLADAAAAAGTTSTTAFILAWSAVLAALIGLAGITLLAILLGRLANWCGDEFSARMLDWATVGVPLCGAVVFVLSLSRPTVGIAAFFALPLLASLGCFALALVSLARFVTWSVLHAQEQAERDEAMREARVVPPDGAAGDPGAEIPLEPEGEHGSS